MSDIPEHIDRIATDIVRAPLNGEEEPDWQLYVLIARALLSAEARGMERAAKIAEANAKFHISAAEISLPISPGPIIAKDRAAVGRTIAAAIRNGTEA